MACQIINSVLTTGDHKMKAIKLSKTQTKYCRCWKLKAKNLKYLSSNIVGERTGLMPQIDDLLTELAKARFQTLNKYRGREIRMRQGQKMTATGRRLIRKGIIVQSKIEWQKDN